MKPYHYLVIAAIVIILLGALYFIPACRAQEIDDNLINAIICVESGWDTNVVSPKGCIGLMQINPIVLDKWKKVKGEKFKYDRWWEWEIDEIYGKKGTDLFNANFNIEVGTWYLNRLKDHYIPKDKFSLELLLACYNAGPTYMRKVHWDIKKAPKETRRYYRKVLNIYYGRTK